MTARLIGPLHRRLVARLTAVSAMPPEVAADLAGQAHRRTGDRGYAARAAAFLVATSPAGRLLPPALRLRAVGALVTALLVSLGDVLRYVGMDEDRPAGCGGLLLP